MAEDLTRLIDTANAPIIGVNLEGRVTEWNAKAVALSGYSKEETMGRPLVDEFITEEYKEQVWGVLEYAFPLLVAPSSPKALPLPRQK